MASTTRDAIFRFHIVNGSKYTFFEYKRPVPAFLCEPDLEQKESQQFYESLIDVLSIVTAEHHDECMSKITTPCVGCGAPSKDALKAPINYLNLAEPMVILQIAGWCGAQTCDTRVRQYLIEKQYKSVSSAQESEKNVFMKMDCAVCNAPDAKRCAGCGQVAYCGVECQKEAWKAHKRSCKRRNLKEGPRAGLPYEAI